MIDELGDHPAEKSFSAFSVARDSSAGKLVREAIELPFLPAHEISENDLPDELYYITHFNSVLIFSSSTLASQLAS